jgi:RHS repeat-associated protein
MLMTTAAICATREVSWGPSFNRGEQYDPDLGLYYLRARYYNPATGRFLSRDPEDGEYPTPATLHKYLYAGGDPINIKDPTGRSELVATAEIDWWTVIKNAAATTAVAVAGACILNTAADLLNGVTTDLGAPVVTISFNILQCRAKVRKKAGQCRFKLFIHPIGMPNHAGLGPFVSYADLGSCKASCPVAKASAYADATAAAPQGWHVQHEYEYCYD